MFFFSLYVYPPGWTLNPWFWSDTSLLWPCTPSTSISSLSRGAQNPERCSRAEPSCIAPAPSCFLWSTLNWNTWSTEVSAPFPAQNAKSEESSAQNHSLKKGVLSLVAFLIQNVTAAVWSSDLFMARPRFSGDVLLYCLMLVQKCRVFLNNT